MTTNRREKGSKDRAGLKSIEAIEREERSYGGLKRKVLSLDLKVVREVVVRRDNGREFHTVGAAKEKDRRAAADFKLGIPKRFLLEERRVLDGEYGVRRSQR